MEISPNNSKPVYNHNNKDTVLTFKEKLKSHLSNEYLYIVDKKDDLENQLLQLKLEQSQKNKTLFPNIDQRGIRKYFSPLNIQEIEEDQNDERDKHLIINIEQIQNEISGLTTRMNEIKEFLSDIDNLLNNPSQEQTSYISDMDYYREEEEVYEEEKDIISSTFPQNVDKIGNNVDYFFKNRDIYPQMIRNLYEFEDYLKSEYNQIEVLIEFNDNNIETSVNINKNLIEQLNFNIIMTMEMFDISTILIQGEINAKSIMISLSYICDEELINGLSVTYSLEYL